MSRVTNVSSNASNRRFIQGAVEVASAVARGRGQRAESMAHGANGRECRAELYSAGKDLPASVGPGRVGKETVAVAAAGISNQYAVRPPVPNGTFGRAVGRKRAIYFILVIVTKNI